MPATPHHRVATAGALALALSTGVLTSQTPGPRTPRPFKQPGFATWAPSKVPDRIILTWTSDPATTQSVTWRTDTTVARSLVQWSLATDGPQFAKKVATASATSTMFRSDLGHAQYHTATLTGLQPDTLYVYRVGDGANWSEWSHFATATAKPSPFSFLYFGDAQNQIKSHWSRVIRTALRNAPRAAFLIHAGDLVNDPRNDHEWGEWCYAAGWILREIPSIAVPGNHEYTGGSLARHWRPMFAFPDHGPKGLEETVYRTDYQGACILSLNTNRSLPAQVAWFEEQMKTCTARWKIVTMHHPLFSTAAKRNSKGLRNTLQPLFDKHKVDLVLQGHDHTYSRTTRMRHAHGAGARPHTHAEKNVPTGLRARDDQSGTVYVVSVSGPKMYTLNRQPFMAKAAANTQLFQVITVEADRVRYSAHTATGKLFDRFELIKTEGKPNRLVEIQTGG